MNKITGTIVNGIGKGAWFVPQYKEKIRSVLGFTPFPGTLNILLDKKNYIAYKKNKQNQKMITAEKTLGAISLMPIIIEHITKSAIVIPEKTTHPEEIIEIIADKNIKDHLHKKEKDEFTFMLP